MYKKGYKITGNKNGRWRDDVNRINDIDIKAYIKFIKSGRTINDACVEFNMLREDVLLLNKKCCKIFNIKPTVADNKDQPIICLIYLNPILIPSIKVASPPSNLVLAICTMPALKKVAKKVIMK